MGAVAVVGTWPLLCLRPGLRTAAAFVSPVLVAVVLALSVGRAHADRRPEADPPPAAGRRVSRGSC